MGTYFKAFFREVAFKIQSLHDFLTVIAVCNNNTKQGFTQFRFRLLVQIVVMLGKVLIEKLLLQK